MRLTVAEHARERREVYAIRNKVQCLNAGDWPPQQRVDAAGVDPGIDGSHAGRLAVDTHLTLSKPGITAALQLTGNVIGHARVPELVVCLALRYHVEKSALNIHRQREGSRERVGGRIEKRCATGGIGSQR